MLRIINEPTAASLAYGLDKKRMSASWCTIWRQLPSTCPSSRSATACSAKSTNGDTYLGGDDFDERVMDWLVGRI